MSKNVKVTRSKIRGVFLGTALGDSLGMPVESFSRQQILDRFNGRITEYKDTTGHKYFDGVKPGTWTDDTNQTLAVARALIKAKGIDLDILAAEHVAEMQSSTLGWGPSTKEAVERLATGIHWRDSGKTESENRGTGNGVCIKVSPIALYLELSRSAYEPKRWGQEWTNIGYLAAMTHYTDIAIISTFLHTAGLLGCLVKTPDTFNRQTYLNYLSQSFISGEGIVKEFGVARCKDDLKNRFDLLSSAESLSDDDIIRICNGGNSYVYNSLPMTYFFFLRNPYTIESLYDVISAGGDTDSNGSMLGGMLGALHGEQVFPQELIDKLPNSELIYQVADEFADVFLTQV